MKLVKHQNGDVSLRTQAKAEFKQMLESRINDINIAINEGIEKKLPKNYITFLETQKMEVNQNIEDLK